MYQRQTAESLFERDKEKRVSRTKSAVSGKTALRGKGAVQVITAAKVKVRVK